MQEHYGVSRESLREGLRLLEVQGLITIRRGPGGGPVVGTVDPANLGRVSTLYYYLAGATYRELFDAWVLSEAIIAELAASNPNEEERMAALGHYLEKGSAPQADDELEVFIGTHLGFHSAIAGLANNRVLSLVLRTSGQIVSHHMAIEDDPRALAEMLEREHLGLAKAIIAGKPAKARRLMEEHIRSVVAVNEAHLGEKVDNFIEWR
jgi:GntR family transcriptional regulator, transcriptional repressor for pyruvate dehydrogenase complex